MFPKKLKLFKEQTRSLLFPVKLVLLDILIDPIICVELADSNQSLAVSDVFVFSVSLICESSHNWPIFKDSKIRRLCF